MSCNHVRAKEMGWCESGNSGDSGLDLLFQFIKFCQGLLLDKLTMGSLSKTQHNVHWTNRQLATERRLKEKLDLVITWLYSILKRIPCHVILTTLKFPDSQIKLILLSWLFDSALSPCFFLKVSLDLSFVTYAWKRWKSQQLTDLESRRLGIDFVIRLSTYQVCYQDAISASKAGLWSGWTRLAKSSCSTAESWSWGNWHVTQTTQESHGAQGLYLRIWTGWGCHDSHKLCCIVFWCLLIHQSHQSKSGPEENGVTTSILYISA